MESQMDWAYQKMSNGEWKQSGRMEEHKGRSIGNILTILSNITNQNRTRFMENILFFIKMAESRNLIIRTEVIMGKFVITVETGSYYMRVSTQMGAVQENIDGFLTMEHWNKSANIKMENNMENIVNTERMEQQKRRGNMKTENG